MAISNPAASLVSPETYEDTRAFSDRLRKEMGEFIPTDGAVFSGNDEEEVIDGSGAPQAEEDNTLPDEADGAEGEGDTTM
jgi:hypothetical protein